MVQQLKDDLLHLRTRHTNLMIPFCEYISSDKFPEQNMELLDTIVPIKFRNMYIVDREDLTEVEKIDPNDVYTENCRVLRCDNTEPYRMICISESYEFMLVTDSRYWEEKVVQYPIQFNEFVGIEVFDQYPAEIPEIKGVTLRVDNGEPCYTIICEFLADNKVRFLIGDECFSKLHDYYGTNIDYDGRDSVEYKEECKDVDGGRITKQVDLGLSFFDIIDGGSADVLKNIFNEAKTQKEIVELRRKCLEGKVIK